MFEKIGTFFYLLMIFALLPSCGKNGEEAIQDAITSANQFLSKSQCQKAIDILEGVGRQNSNSTYLLTLSSAYACRGNFSQLTFFTTDIIKTGTPSPLGGFTTYSTSADMTTPGDSDFENLNIALNILIYAGGLDQNENASSAKRKAIFSDSKSGDIDAVILYMTMVQLGRFLNFYGNPNATGDKGNGGSGAQCILNYDGTLMQDTPAVNLDAALGAGLTGPCTAAADGGSTDIGTFGSYNITRICQGVFLLNNFLDVLPSVLDSYSGGELSSISSIRATLQAQSGILKIAKTGMGPILEVTNLSKCISDNTDDDTFLQWYYAYMMEPIYL